MARVRWRRTLLFLFWVSRPLEIVTRRLGIAYVRMMDFLVAGAVVKEVLLGD
jgi:hypothetical protein